MQSSSVKAMTSPVALAMPVFLARDSPDRGSWTHRAPQRWARWTVFSFSLPVLVSTTRISDPAGFRAASASSVSLIESARLRVQTITEACMEFAGGKTTRGPTAPTGHHATRCTDAYLLANEGKTHQPLRRAAEPLVVKPHAQGFVGNRWRKLRVISEGKVEARAPRILRPAQELGVEVAHIFIDTVQARGFEFLDPPLPRFDGLMQVHPIHDVVRQADAHDP